MQHGWKSGQSVFSVCHTSPLTCAALVLTVQSPTGTPGLAPHQTPPVAGAPRLFPTLS